MLAVAALGAAGVAAYVVLKASQEPERPPVIPVRPGVPQVVPEVRGPPITVTVPVSVTAPTGRVEIPAVPPAPKPGETTAMCIGKVLDFDTRRPIPNARVFLDGLATVSGSDGTYRFSGVKPGTYLATVIAGSVVVSEQMVMNVGVNTCDLLVQRPKAAEPLVPVPQPIIVPPRGLEPTPIVPPVVVPPAIIEVKPPAVVAPVVPPPTVTPAPKATITGAVTSTNPAGDLISVPSVRISIDGSVLGFTDAQGRFNIANLAPGTWGFTFWAQGYLEGTLEKTVVSGVNDLGEISLPPLVAPVKYTFFSMSDMPRFSVSLPPYTVPFGSTQTFGARALQGWWIPLGGVNYILMSAMDDVDQWNNFNMNTRQAVYLGQFSISPAEAYPATAAAAQARGLSP